MRSKESSPEFQPPKQEKADWFSPTPEEEILSNREITSKNELFSSGFNKVYCLEFKDDGKGIFKPREGERFLERRHTAPGTYYRRERAAYLVDRFLSLSVVPPTVIRKIEHETGSIQQFIPDAKTPAEISPDDWSEEQTIPEIKNQMLKMFILDHIIFNSDRNGNNLLLSKDDKIHAIDNGLSFGNDTLKIFPDDSHIFSGRFYEKQIPEEVIEQIKTALADTEKQQELDKLLRELLTDKDREAFFVRLNRIGNLIIEKGCIPSPYKSDPRLPDLGVRSFN